MVLGALERDLDRDDPQQHRAHAALQLVDGERARLEELAQRRECSRPLRLELGRQLREAALCVLVVVPAAAQVDGDEGDAAAARLEELAEQRGNSTDTNNN